MTPKQEAAELVQSFIPMVRNLKHAKECALIAIDYRIAAYAVTPAKNWAKEKAARFFNVRKQIEGYERQNRIVA